MCSTDMQRSGEAKSRSIIGKDRRMGMSKMMGAMGREVGEISAESSMTWKGLPPSTGSGMWFTREAMKYSSGYLSEDSDSEYTCRRNRCMAL